MKHYKQRQRESIEIIKDALTDEQFKGFLIGNIYKYLNRYEYKQDPQGDLYKAASYIYALIRVLDYPQIENPFQPYLSDETSTMGTDRDMCLGCGHVVDACVCDSPNNIGIDNEC